MRDPIILVVSSDQQQRQVLARALEALGMPRPTSLEDGQAALLWVAANHCDVCVLAFNLQGNLDGLNTLHGIRQRRPELPVVMVSDSGTEQDAVAAFHGGVADYVPVRPGYEQAVAQLVRRIAEAAGESEVVPTQLVAAGVADELLQPNYQNRLRVIGRQLDLLGYRSVNVLEVAGGFVVRAVQTGSRQPEALEFADQYFPQMVATAIAARGEGERRTRSTARLTPTGYEDCLRALGYRLDAHLAEAVTITELEEFLAVGGVGKLESYNLTTVGPIQWLLREPDITFMLDEAYKRRRPEAQSQRRSSIFSRIAQRDGTGAA